MADVTPSDHHSSPWAQRGFILAAAFIGGLVLLGLALLLIGTGGGDDDANVRPNSKAPAAAPPRKDPNASVCGLPPGDQQVPAAPPEAQWELVGTIAAPSAPSIGPGIDKGPRRLCFAHSPTGALFAAVNFVAVAGEHNENDELMRELTATTAARDELLARQDIEGRSEPDARVQVVGFRIAAASDNEVTVELAFSARGSGQQGFVGMTLPMRWERGDWKLVITSTAQAYAVQPLDSMSGYVPWSGA